MEPNNLKSKWNKMNKIRNGTKLMAVNSQKQEWNRTNRKMNSTIYQNAMKINNGFARNRAKKG